MKLNRYTYCFDLLVQHFYGYLDWFISALDRFIFNSHYLTESSHYECLECSTTFLQIDELNTYTLRGGRSSS